MKVIENMDGIVVAAIGLLLVSNLVLAAVPSRSDVTAPQFDNQVHTVVISAKRLTAEEKAAFN